LGNGREARKKAKLMAKEIKTKEKLKAKSEATKVRKWSQVKSSIVTTESGLGISPAHSKHSSTHAVSLWLTNPMCWLMDSYRRPR
jgi:hypothetical protein